MKCPKCKGPTAVRDSRDRTRPGVHRWRRRQCLDCDFRYTTMEIPFMERDEDLWDGPPDEDIGTEDGKGD